MANEQKTKGDLWAWALSTDRSNWSIEDNARFADILSREAIRSEGFGYDEDWGKARLVCHDTSYNEALTQAVSGFEEAWKRADRVVGRKAPQREPEYAAPQDTDHDLDR